MIRVALLLAIAAWATSCASAPRPVETGRSGFFARLARGSKGAKARGPASGAPGAVVVSEMDPENAQVPTGPRKLKLRWPLSEVRITSTFGKRGKEFHEGIDLHAGVGTPVYAAEAGTVIYAGRRIRGYGKMIVIRHQEGFASVYAHNSKLLVMNGQKVARGQKIAMSGKTGKVRGPHVHFELRSGVSAVDPQLYMPQARLASAK